MIEVLIEGPHPALGIVGQDSQRHYMPWRPLPPVVDWLTDNCKKSYLTAHEVEMSFEQGVGQIPFFVGIRFIFEDHDEAMLFKLTFL